MKKYLVIISMISFIFCERKMAEEIYDYKDIVTIKWGASDGKIGEGVDLISLPDIIKANSRNERIYLYDNANAKIESFDYEGNHLFPLVTDIKNCNAILFDNENNIFLIKADQSGPKIDVGRYSPKGDLLNKFDLAPGNLNKAEPGYSFIVEITRMFSPKLNNNKEFWILDVDASEVIQDVKAKNVVSVSEPRKYFEKKKELIDKEKDIYEYYIEIKDEDNKKILSTFPVDERFGKYSLTFVDKNNFIYLLRESSEMQINPESFKVTGHEIRLGIAKYNMNGELILKQRLIEDYGIKGLENKKHSFIDIDEDGRIFQILGKEDGVHILKWEQVTIED